MGQNLDYTLDILNDKILKDVKTLSHSYLNGHTHVLDIDKAYLEISEKFLNKKYGEILNLKESLKVDYYCYPFKEISQSMDNMTLTTPLDKYEEEHILRLTKDLSYLLDDLEMNISILRKMKSEREIYLKEIDDL